MQQEGLAALQLGALDAPRPYQSARKGPACAVCQCSLRDARVFHQRYHVCPEHATADQVVLHGVLQRFCQQCGRFHELERFAPSMRSCRQQLARHAERRRHRRAVAAAAKAAARTAPPSGAHLSAPGGAVMPAPPTAAAPGSGLPLPDAKRPRLEGPEAQLAALLQQQAAAAGVKLEQADAGGTGSGRQQDGSCASVQSTHSTHINNTADGLDALLAAAQEEEQEVGQQARAAAAATKPAKPAAAAWPPAAAPPPAPPPPPPQWAPTAPALPPLPLPETWQPAQPAWQQQQWDQPRFPPAWEAPPALAQAQAQAQAGWELPHFPPAWEVPQTIPLYLPAFRVTYAYSGPEAVMWQDG
ncbi:hypothetical protein CHLNCDRAFT_145623 [Chlorella variabilis]|uniref:SBP-type domain-containing protein n=1 Tax=Chlorella variabilis TaxID=554065 RepID=E1ZDV6_CHLVA|nr:hypothetical protein CHLNCDRAFT_145623 [Chlorella variabilis]EFN56093.1 hypothetical protein CHLNCDRAFT_145623 [Chlorella variabilis]|eukprot:XP_005848195.1 hypothetical protein CHLNCDRAFT_145623 [Chlorella variabilis]